MTLHVIVTELYLTEFGLVIHLLEILWKKVSMHINADNFTKYLWKLECSLVMDMW